jgi:hypothetical protein
MIDVLLSAFLLTQTPAPAPAPEPPPALSALHAAQVDAHLAKLRALELEIQLQQIAFSEQRAKLEAAIVAAHPGFRFDWATRALVKAEPPGKDVPR